MHGFALRPWSKRGIPRRLTPRGSELQSATPDGHNNLGNPPSEGAAKSGAVSGGFPSDPDLARVLDVWPTLPGPSRLAIVALIGMRGSQPRRRRPAVPRRDGRPGSFLNAAAPRPAPCARHGRTPCAAHASRNPHRQYVLRRRCAAVGLTDQPHGVARIRVRASRIARFVSLRRPQAVWRTPYAARMRGWVAYGLHSVLDPGGRRDDSFRRSIPGPAGRFPTGQYVRDFVGCAIRDGRLRGPTGRYAAS